MLIFMWFDDDYTYVSSSYVHIYIYIYIYVRMIFKHIMINPSHHGMGICANMICIANVCWVNSDSVLKKSCLFESVKT